MSINKNKLERLERTINDITIDDDSGYQQLVRECDDLYDVQPEKCANLLLAWSDDLLPYFVDKLLTFEFMLNVAHVYPDVVQLNDLLNSGAMIEDSENWQVDVHKTLEIAFHEIYMQKHCWRLDPATGERMRDNDGYLLPTLPLPAVYKEFEDCVDCLWRFTAGAYMSHPYSPAVVRKFVRYCQKRHDSRVALVKSCDILELGKMLLSVYTPPRVPLFKDSPYNPVLQV